MNLTNDERNFLRLYKTTASYVRLAVLCELVCDNEAAKASPALEMVRNQTRGEYKRAIRFLRVSQAELNQRGDRQNADFCERTIAFIRELMDKEAAHDCNTEP